MNGLDDRYSRQILLPEIGSAGQRNIWDTSALVIGCGALGSALAELLARAGVGILRIVDRDFVERSNLARQLLFDESDAERRLPKAVAAVSKLRAINSEIDIDGAVVDINPRNIEAHITKASIVLDGTDNVETRYLINDACVKHGKPWVYGGAVGTDGLVMAVVPGQGPCLRCLVPDPPRPGTLPTCDTAGIIGSTPVAVAALQVAEALKLITGDHRTVGRLTKLNLWENRFLTLRVPRSDECPCCAKKRYDFLKAEATAWTTILCGRNAVQITPGTDAPVDFVKLKAILSKVAIVHDNGFILTFEVDGHDIALFPDGRAVIKGTVDESAARGLLAKYIGI